jgi:hypothetical protein
MVPDVIPGKEKLPRSDQFEVREYIKKDSLEGSLTQDREVCKRKLKRLFTSYLTITESRMLHYQGLKSSGGAEFTFADFVRYLPIVIS